jgi:hypothetical protein
MGYPSTVENSQEVRSHALSYLVRIAQPSPTLYHRSKHRWERENGLAPDFTAVREEAARRKAAKDEEARVLRERLEQEDDVGVI